MMAERETYEEYITRMKRVNPKTICEMCHESKPTTITRFSYSRKKMLQICNDCADKDRIHMPYQSKRQTEALKQMRGDIRDIDLEDED